MAVALTFTDSAANVLNLHDLTNFRLLALLGAGIGDVAHQAVATPLQDGETYIRTLLLPRYLTVQIALIGTTFDNLQTQRRSLVTRLNPKLGLGTLKWTPIAAGTVYALDCLVMRGAEFSDHKSATLDFATVQFYAPDPSWYNVTITNTDITVPDGGLEFAITFPITFSVNSASSVINNTGDVVSYPVVSLTGPCTGFQIKNSTTGKYINLPSLAVLTGETLTIDMKQKTIEVGGTSVLSYLTTDSEFWPLATGNNTVLATISAKDAAVTVNVDWYVRYLGV